MKLIFISAMWAKRHSIVSVIADYDAIGCVTCGILIEQKLIYFAHIEMSVAPTNS